MLRRFAALVFMALTWIGPAGAADGVVVVASPYSVAATMDRLEAAVRNAGIGVVARVDHAANATKAGFQMAPSQLLIFGNPKIGTPPIQQEPTVGLDLPLKVLVYQDAAGKVWAVYNDPAWLARRHGLGPEVARSIAPETKAAFQAMGGALAKLVGSATGAAQ